MCLNQFLHDEQSLMMRCAAATDPEEITLHRRQLLRLGRQIATHPYPHRPYFSWDRANASAPPAAEIRT